MSVIRKAASRLLQAMVRRSSTEGRTWAEAMLREVDFVENDWSALLWALGGATVLCKHSISQQLRIWFDKNRAEAMPLKIVVKKTPAVLLGIAVAGAVLAMCVMGLLGLLDVARLDAAHEKLADRMLIVVIPEAVYAVSVATLWRYRKSVALGILAAGVILMTHAIVHFATHG